MIITTTNCPSCGAQIVFRQGSTVVVICEYCNSAVARTDKDIRNLGKVADILDTRSPLEVGKEGRYEGKPFVLTGRAQIKHPAGGVWDEWYATFGDGRTGWLAEAQGRFYLTFPTRVDDPRLVPPLSAVRPGMAGPLPGSAGRFVVNEVNFGTFSSAEGEIPYELTPGENFTFADFSGERGAFATIDYGEQPPVVYVGRQVTLKDLGIFGEGDEFSATERRVGGVRLTCPKCGGPMELRAPESERTTCPNCNSLLDINEGNLAYLRTLDPGPPPLIALGSKATFEGHEMTVVGFMVRYCIVDRKKYVWEEYLLYHTQVGFRWLVHDTGHWSYVSPISPADVFDGVTVASMRGSQFKQFQAVNAFVESVFGEFYWQVEVGESTRAKDFVNPPEILSLEASATEVNWSHGRYMTHEEVAKAFRLKKPLPAPGMIGMAQPNPFAGLAKPWFILLGIALFVATAIFVTGSRRQVFAQTFTFEPVENSTATQVVFTEPVELKSFQNICIDAQAAVDNSWVYLEGDFVNEDTGLVQNFSIPVEYYHGVDGGESWSEGGQSSQVFISSLPAGKYVMRFEAQWDKYQQPVSVQIRIRQGVPRLWHIIALLIVLAIGPIIILIRHRTFEVRRWSESMFNPYSTD